MKNLSCRLARAWFAVASPTGLAHFCGDWRDDLAKLDPTRKIPIKAVILAGGLGTRLSEETQLCPKPMVEIGGRPILWHIMNLYSAHGINDFIICLGYRGIQIKDYFVNYRLHEADVTVDLRDGRVSFHRCTAEPWCVTLVDTGEATHTGGRLKRIAPYVADEKAFCMTYGDGLADINLRALVAFHSEHGKLASITAVQPPGRFGALDRSANAVNGFSEKPLGDRMGTINGGFFVLSPRALDRIEGDATAWEREPLESLARDGELQAYDHHGFWQPMDTMRDRTMLERLWASGQAPWIAG
jgi:glucose-1-phosphate cytidylyltransferase